MSIAVRTASVPVNYLDDVDANGIAVRWWKPPQVASVPFAVVWSHPSGQNERWTPSYNIYPMLHAVINMGGAWVGTNQRGTTSWGTDLATSDVAGAAAFLATKVTVQKWIIAGGSMGGMPTLRFINANTAISGVPIKGAVLVDGVCNLSNMYANAVYTANIETAHGITAGTLSGATIVGATSLPTTASFPTIGTVLRVGNGTANVEDVTTTGASTGTTVAVTALTKTHASGAAVSDYPTKTAGKDPYLLAAGSWGAVPLRFYADLTGDTAVPAPSHCVPFAAALGASATPPAEYGITAHKGGHLAPQGAIPSDLIAFIERCLAR